jgi:hypothetical protein
MDIRNVFRACKGREAGRDGTRESKSESESARAREIKRDRWGCGRRGIKAEGESV